VVFLFCAFYTWFSFLRVCRTNRMYGYLEHLRSAKPICICLFRSTYLAALLCLTISWNVRNFGAGCSCQSAKKKELIVVSLNSVAGGVMGYMKSGSQKSLAAGGISALVLYVVHTQLPVRPVLASSIGLGMQNLFFPLILRLFSLLGSLVNLDSSPDIVLIPRSRYICRATVSDGVALQEVREGIPCRRRVPCIPGYGRRLLPRDLA
jgi:hypothetical protein